MIRVDEFLRVAVDDGEPRTLYLNHQPVAGEEGVRHVVKGIFHRRDAVRRESLRAVEALAITATEELAANHQLVAAHRIAGVGDVFPRLFGISIIFWEYID